MDRNLRYTAWLVWFGCLVAGTAAAAAQPADLGTTPTASAQGRVVSPGPDALQTTVQQAGTKANTSLRTLPAESSIPELMFYSEEPMLASATKRLERVSEVPGSVTIITEQEIRERGALTLSEMLRNETSIEMTNESILETVRFRGMQSIYNNKILLLVDGRKINTVDWGNFEDTYGNLLDNIKQIEIVKGPGSALYGANAFAGVINIVTKDGKDLQGLDTKVVFNTKSGDDEPSRVVLVNYGRSQGKWDYVLSAGYWDEWGIDLINPETPNNHFEGNHVDVSLKYGEEATIRAGFKKTLEPYPGNFFSPLPKEQNDQDTLYLDTKYVWDLGAGSKLSFRLEDTYSPQRDVRSQSFTMSRTAILTPADLPPGAAVIVDDQGGLHPVANAVGASYITLAQGLSLLNGTALSYGYWSGPMNEGLGEVQYDLAWPDNNYLLAGISYVTDWSGQDYFMSPTVSDQNYAVYAQDEYHALENLSLLAGVRYDYNTGYGSNLSPRGSAIYTLLPGLRVKALYGSAFCAPQFNDRYIQSTSGFITFEPNLEVKPQKTWQTEADVEYEFGKWLQAKAGCFYWETSDEIQPTAARDTVYVFAPNLSLIRAGFPAEPGLYYSDALNAASTIIQSTNNNSRLGKGLELELTAHPIPYTKVVLNYSHDILYLKTAPAAYLVDDGTTDLINGILGFNYENRFFLNFYAHLESAPRDYWTNLLSSTWAGSMTVWLNEFDVTAGARIKNVNLVLAIYNVFENDQTYDQTTNRYVPGPRVLRLSAEYAYRY